MIINNVDSKQQICIITINHFIYLFYFIKPKKAGFNLTQYHTGENEELWPTQTSGIPMQTLCS